MTTTSDVRSFHAGIYTDAFPGQLEPVESWLAGLRGETPYDFRIRLEADAGITYERYRASNCGLVTYLVVAPAARRTGIGRRLLDEAVADLRAMGVHHVFGEVNDPRRTGEWARLERFQRWGARVVDTRYVQPSLGSGRDRGLLLIEFAARGDHLDGAVLRGFVDEFYALTEGGDPDPEIAIPDRVPLVERKMG